MKASDRRLGAILLNVAVICLAHPEGGRESDRSQEIGVGGTYNTKLSTVEVRSHENSIKSSQSEGGHTSSEGNDSRQGKDGDLTNKSSTFNSGEVNEIESITDESHRMHSNIGSHPGVSGELNDGHSDPPSSGRLHPEHDGGEGRGVFDGDDTVPVVGGGPAHIGAGADDTHGRVLEPLSAGYVSHGASQAYGSLGRGNNEPAGGRSFTDRRGSVATAIINFNLGAPIQRSVGYSGANDISFGTYSDTTTRGGEYDSVGDMDISVVSNGYIADGSSKHGGSVGGYNNQGNIDGIIHTNHYDKIKGTVAIEDRGVKIRGGYGGGDSDSGERGFNPAEDNGVLVGGGVGGVYLTSTNEDGANHVPAFGEDEFPKGDYSTQTERGGGISTVGYSAPKVNKGKGSEGIYSHPDVGEGNRSGGSYNSLSSGSGGGIKGRQSGSIIQSGILEAEYIIQNDNNGYGTVKY